MLYLRDFAPLASVTIAGQLQSRPDIMVCIREWGMTLGETEAGCYTYGQKESTANNGAQNKWL